MTEWKTLSQLWEENGRKQIEVIHKDGARMTVVSETGCPIGAFLMYIDPDNKEKYFRSSGNLWKLYTPEPELVPHWPAIFKKPNSYERPYISQQIYPQDVEDFGGVRDIDGNDLGFIRLAKEYPPIMLPRKK